MLTRTFVALGFVGAIAIGTPAPTLAQGVYEGRAAFGLIQGDRHTLSGATEPTAATPTSVAGSAGAAQ